MAFKDDLIHNTRLYNAQIEENCVECNDNPTFPWCEELIEYWKQDVYWPYLAQNKIFLSHQNLVSKYWHHLKPHEQLMQETLSFRPLSECEDAYFDFPSKTQKHFLFRKEYERLFPEDITWSYEAICKHEKFISWWWFSRCKFIEWDEHIATKYRNVLDKGSVLRNKSFPINTSTLQALEPTTSQLMSVSHRLWNELFKDVVNDQFVEDLFAHA